MDLNCVMEFLKGMVKPQAVLVVILMAVLFSWFQRLKLEGVMVYSIFRVFFISALVHYQNKKYTGFAPELYVAGYTAGRCSKHIPCGMYVAGISVLARTSVTMFLLVLLNVFPLTPRYIFPVAGMMVGNAMTVTGVTMKRG